MLYTANANELTDSALLTAFVQVTRRANSIVTALHKPASVQLSGRINCFVSIRASKAFAKRINTLALATVRNDTCTLVSPTVGSLDPLFSEVWSAEVVQGLRERGISASLVRVG